MDDVQSERSRWLILLLVIVAIAVMWMFKLAGILFLLACSIAAFLIFRTSDSKEENAQLRRSIWISAGEITDILEQWDDFKYGTSTETLADRLLTRPLLNDPDCTVPEIQRFYFIEQSCRDFINSLDKSIARARTSRKLERLLFATDRRSEDLRHSWQQARIVAARMGSAG